MDEEQRAIYDRYGEEGLEQHRNGGGGGGFHSPFDIFSQFFGGGGGGFGKLNKMIHEACHMTNDDDRWTSCTATRT